MRYGRVAIYLQQRSKFDHFLITQVRTNNIANNGIILINLIYSHFSFLMGYVYRPPSSMLVDDVAVQDNFQLILENYQVIS